MTKSSLIFSAAILTLSGTATAQTSEEAAEASIRLDTIKVAGIRPVTPADITTSVTLIDASDLAVRDAPYFADQLRAVPGLGVSRSGAKGGLTQVRIRGAEANHTLVLLDGIEISDPQTGETDFGLLSGFYPARVEVLRGEQSALFGSDAVGGVVNIVSDAQDGFRGLLEGGSRSTYRLDAALGQTTDNGHIRLAFADSITDGVDTSGLDGGEDGSQNYSLLTNGAWKFAETWQVSGLARFSYGELDFDSDTDFDGLLNDVDRVSESEQFTLGAALEGDAFGLNHVFRASLNQVERETFEDGSSLRIADSERTKLSYSPSIAFNTGEAEITVSGLVDWEEEDYSARDSEFGGFTNQDQSFETLGLAGEVSATINKLALNASARLDDNDGVFDDAETWRAGAAYNFDFGGRLRGSIGTGVKNPTFTELFGFFPGSFAGNPDLKPEESESWEIGWDQSYSTASWSFTYFEAELENEIEDNFDVFPFSSRNREGKSERSGVELAGSVTVTPALSLSGSLSNVSSTNDAGEDEVRVPEWTGSLATNWVSPDKEGFRLGLAVDYVGEQLDFFFPPFPQPRETVELDAYWLVSATVEYPITKTLSLTLRGENLLDEDIVDVFGYTGPGAGVFVGLRLR